MAHVTKPCPECGGTDSIRDTPISICRRCKGLIAFALQRKKDDAKRDGEEVLVRTKERSYALPGYYVQVGANPDHPVRERLEKALHAVIMAQSRPSNIGKYPCPKDVEDAVHVPTTRKSDRDHDWITYVFMRKDQAMALVELEEAMREYIMAGAAASYEEGRNLLLSIAAGKLSMDDINKAHL